jgi:hypothetical protein
MEAIYIFIVLVITWITTFVKINQITHIKLANFIICTLHSIERVLIGVLSKLGKSKHPIWVKKWTLLGKLNSRVLKVKAQCPQPYYHSRIRCCLTCSCVLMGGLLPPLSFPPYWASIRTHSDQWGSSSVWVWGSQTPVFGLKELAIRLVT